MCPNKSFSSSCFALYKGMHTQSEMQLFLSQEARNLRFIFLTVKFNLGIGGSFDLHHIGVTKSHLSFPSWLHGHQSYSMFMWNSFPIIFFISQV